MSTQLNLLRGTTMAATLEVNPDDPGHAIADIPCPECSSSPLRVAGTGRRIAGRDRYEADGFCIACNASVGTIVAVVDTIFGLEEDERMMELAHSRGIKVY